VVDRWVLSRLATVTALVDAGYEDFQFAKTTDALYHFVWDEFCDWYLELAKLPLQAGGGPAEVTRRVLGEVLDVVLRLLHPVAPFVTEALWTELTGGESLVVAAWPAGDPARAVLALDPAAESEVAALQRLVTQVRRFRAEQGLRAGKRVPGRITGLDRTALAGHEAEVRLLATLNDPDADFAPSVKLSDGEVTVELDLRGAIDVGAELRRLDKELAAARKDRDASAAKLANADFLAKAPEPVVTKIRTRLATADADIERITAQVAALA
jgi:valyl-tRNA synthetase